MAASDPLFRELADINAPGNSPRRAQAVREIGDLFVSGASQFSKIHVELFDNVLSLLVPDTEVRVRADLSMRLAPLENAPPTLVIQLARDDEIAVAGPVLRQSPVLDDATLVDIARRKGQDHLHAIAERAQVSEIVTDVIVRRGDRRVVRQVAANEGARLSVKSYGDLVQRAGNDGVLATNIGRRADLPPPLLRELIVGAVDLVRKHILAAVKPERQAAIQNILVEVSGDANPIALPRDFTHAQQAVLALHRDGELNEEALHAFVQERRYEESVAAIAALSGIAIPTVDRLLSGDRADSVLILGRSIDLGWRTVRALMLLRQPPGKGPSNAELDRAEAQFEHLSPLTAQRVLQFWQSRPEGPAAR